MELVEEVPDCIKYAGFLHALPRQHVELIFWISFVVVMLLLFLSSTYFGKTMTEIGSRSRRDPTRHHKLIVCYWFILAQCLLASILVCLEALALLYLQFCGSEPLVGLYWSAWFTLQAGTIIAISGIALHLEHMVNFRRQPPWALALGTPVLVCAGAAHAFHGAVRARIGDSQARSCSESDGTSSNDMRERTRSRDDGEDRAHGLSNDGGGTGAQPEPGDWFRFEGRTDGGAFVMRREDRAQRDF